jgi:hypothetical protein
LFSSPSDRGRKRIRAPKLQRSCTGCQPHAWLPPTCATAATRTARAAPTRPTCPARPCRAELRCLAGRRRGPGLSVAAS